MKYDEIKRTKKEGMLTINCNMPFGKYQGMSVLYVLENKPDYLIWCHHNYMRITESLFNAIEEPHHVVEVEVTAHEDDIMMVRDDYDVCTVNGSLYMYLKTLELAIDDTVLYQREDELSVGVVTEVNLVDVYLETNGKKLSWVTDKVSLANSEKLLDQDLKMVEMIQKDKRSNAINKKRLEVIDSLTVGLYGKLRKLMP